MKLAFRSEVLSVSMATSRISSLVMMQPLKSLKPCCLKWSFCWILTPEDFWNFSTGMDYLIRLQRLDLEGWVVSLSFPVCLLLLWMAPNHFHFRVVLWFGLFLRLPFLLEQAPRRLLNFSRHKCGAYSRAALIWGWHLFKHCTRQSYFLNIFI